MRILNIVLIVIIVLLSIAAGSAKVMAVPEEVRFLERFGFSIALISAYGIGQILGGLLLALPKTRMIGAVITIVAFSISTVLIVVSGNVVFGLVSVVPIALTCFVVAQTRKPALNKLGVDKG